ncbi:asparagine synthase (glutamine-hydrolyzing) [Flavobacterium hydrophilum]|uniref:asparagine synthase (glutamine-hydrolyzing) n=1 Tax=Flavobacterium hydrophilum TaxID=2211445 RepID=A0A2V4BYH5_9FLAO|nr:asparagine synthase (glutamine-hydrolyzing) [Flavobacterium hydrophilum]PXY44061.1 asparagine synthase (glutamine-hydrolyzing) [Flavobacterium hydrophilum]
MCGINGFISHHPNIEMQKVLCDMNNAIIHRGPDQDGFFEDNSSNCKIGMAMRRLSIIDLNLGKQPIFTEDKQKVVIFNGEIYNFKVLKNDLEKKGIEFVTNSDTEVIVKLYECYGIKAFSMLDGMFAFSIYDKTLNKVLIARDFFGEKPLYYTKTNDSFIWASELKSIIKVLPVKPSINARSLNLFLQLTYIPAPYTIYDNIHKLESNHYIEFDCSNFEFEIHEIEQKHKDYSEISKLEATKITHDLIQDSINSRSISDVSLGTFLSGGVDSSIISLCLAQQSSTKIETFSIGFDKKSFDETEKSRTVAKLINSNHHEFIISEKDLTTNINEIILNFDEPFADSSALASYIVSSKTKEFVKVALTGDGGDEVFGGYNKYYMGRLNDKYINLIPKTLHNTFSSTISKVLNTNEDNRGGRFKINKLLKSINYEGDFYYNIISLGFYENEIREILKRNKYVENSLSFYKDKIGNHNKNLTDFRNIDKMISLEGDMIVKVDRTSMLTSLECRAPFLNKEIWNFTSQLPEDFLIKGWDKKHILKESFKKYFPKDFLNKPKKGFGVPVGDWLRGNLKNELLLYVDKIFIEDQNIFHFETIWNLVNNHLEGKIDNTFKVWTFFCFQKWYRESYEK